MKTIISCLVLCCSVPALGQVAESLLAELPAPPDNVCRGGGDAIGTFNKQLLEKMRVIDAELAKCRKQERAARKEMESRLRAQAMAAAGISPSVAAGAKRMSKEEKRALAAQVLQEQTGLTMEDIEKLKTMAPAEREAWATARQATGGIGPKNPPPAQPAALPDSGLTAEEMKEQQKLFEDSMALGTKLQARYSKLELEYAAIQRPPKPKLKDGEEPPPDNICLDFTKRYKAILSDHYAATRQVVQAARRLDELTAKQYGLPTAPGAGHTALSAVHDYALKLQGILGKFSG